MNEHDEEKRLRSKIADMKRLSEKRYEPCYTDFLGDGEQTIAKSTLSAFADDNNIFWGGFDGAQRVVLCVYPEYAKPEPQDFPIEALHVKYRESAQLSHRDFLGALMSLGIKREAVGDILTDKGTATFFVKRELAPYIRAQIETIGREGVKFTDRGVNISALVQKFEERSGTVSSLRLDAVVSESAHLSRAKAAAAIKSGYVAVGGITVTDADRRISDGDKITVRGYGKFIIASDGELSKKGKVRVTIKKYS